MELAEIAVTPLLNGIVLEVASPAFHEMSPPALVNAYT
jgi:hypothetical protein